MKEVGRPRERLAKAKIDEKVMIFRINISNYNPYRFYGACELRDGST